MTDPTLQSPEQPISASGVLLHYQALHANCGAVLAESFSGGLALLHSVSHTFATDLATWMHALAGRREYVLLEQGTREYQYALLALVQGHYRQSFAALRLSLELLLAAVFYSANEMLLREWLAGLRDNNWRRITISKIGIFTERFAKAFNADLAGEAPHYASIARKTYRECSEYVHGNPEASASIPDTLRFDESSFRRWHEGAASMRVATTFFLVLRYFGELTDEKRAILEPTIRDQLGHIELIRSYYHSDTATS